MSDDSIPNIIFKINHERHSKNAINTSLNLDDAQTDIKKAIIDKPHFAYFSDDNTLVLLTPENITHFLDDNQKVKNKEKYALFSCSYDTLLNFMQPGKGKQAAKLQLDYGESKYQALAMNTALMLAPTLSALFFAAEGALYAMGLLITVASLYYLLSVIVIAGVSENKGLDSVSCIKQLVTTGLPLLFSQLAAFGLRGLVLSNPQSLGIFFGALLGVALLTAVTATAMQYMMHKKGNTKLHPIDVLTPAMLMATFSKFFVMGAGLMLVTLAPGVATLTSNPALVKGITIGAASGLAGLMSLFSGRKYDTCVGKTPESIGFFKRHVEARQLFKQTTDNTDNRGLFLRESRWDKPILGPTRALTPA